MPRTSRLILLLWLGLLASPADAKEFWETVTNNPRSVSGQSKYELPSSYRRRQNPIDHQYDRPEIMRPKTRLYGEPKEVGAGELVKEKKLHATGRYPKPLWADEQIRQRNYTISGRQKPIDELQHMPKNTRLPGTQVGEFAADPRGYRSPVQMKLTHKMMPEGMSKTEGEPGPKPATGPGRNQVEDPNFTEPGIRATAFDAGRFYPRRDQLRKELPKNPGYVADKLAPKEFDAGRFYPNRAALRKEMLKDADDSTLKLPPETFRGNKLPDAKKDWNAKLGEPSFTPDRLRPTEFAPGKMPKPEKSKMAPVFAVN